VHNDPALAEMHVIWITAGLGCDGDTIAMTAATNPSIEDLVLGALPGIPMVRLHNPVLGLAPPGAGPDQLAR
jgi:hydrogenase small subunit